MHCKQTDKKKVCIVTLLGYFNYGNRLQNLALQKTYESLGCEVNTLMYSKGSNKKSESLNLKLIRFVKLPLGEKIRFIKKIFERGKIEKQSIDTALEMLRTKRFKDFSRQYIHETDALIEDDNIPEGLKDSFDCFIVGSDQVWHPRTGFSDDLFFLRFAPEHKRATYAPSFGVDVIPRDRRSEYKTYISEIPHLSVREASGRNIIQSLTDKIASLVLDPTMLLNKKEWESIRKEPACKPKNKYMLVCFLGEVPKKTRDLIDSIANEYKLEVMELVNPKMSEAYSVNPAEFIDCVADAAIVMTDSFHTTAFSILYEVPFVVSERVQNKKTTMTRLHSLMNMFGFEDRAIDIISNNMAKVFEIDFSNTKDKLNIERKKSLKYLTSVIEG